MKSTLLDRRLSMKAFSSLKIPMMLILGAGAMLVLAPSSRAQAEIAPDHYDAVEAPSTAAKPKAVPAHAKQASANLTHEQRKGELGRRRVPGAANWRREREPVSAEEKRNAVSSNSAPR